MGAADIHCHILPGVDDGAEDVSVTEEMLAAARRAGVGRIVATPHLKSTSADVGRVRARYEEVLPLFEAAGAELLLGFECHYRLLLDWEPRALRSFCIAGTNVLLLELPSGGLPLHWENSLNELQSCGMELVIAHPERYAAVQKDLDIARRMAEIGCELQLSSDSLADGIFSARRKCAMALLRAGLANYIASDAHCAQDYRHYKRAMEQHGSMLRRGSLL